MIKIETLKFPMIVCQLDPTYNKQNICIKSFTSDSTIYGKIKTKKQTERTCNDHENPLQPSLVFVPPAHENNRQITKKNTYPRTKNKIRQTSKILRSNSSASMTSNESWTFQSNEIFDKLSQHNFDRVLQCKVYRCQLKTRSKNWCSSCNSDAMFEVMKGLYDCYKMKNCDNCNCILCGHLPRENRQKEELRTSMTSIEIESKSIKVIKEKIKTAEQAMVGKTPEEIEKILQDLAMAGVPLPKAKTQSVKSLINKVQLELGLPPTPKTAVDKASIKKAAAAGLLIPLEGKTPEQKRTILMSYIEMGVPLPEGRTPSEKALIHHLNMEAGIPLIISSQKLQNATAAGVLQGKTPEIKESILRGLADLGITLPEGKTKSERKLIDKIRTDLGLPPTPTTPTMKEKHAKAAVAGLLLPLEGKSAKEKENIIRGLHNIGIPLPVGRTASETSVISRIKKEPRKPSLLPTERMRKAKAEGLLTPLTGKSRAQKERIIRGLALAGLPLLEGKTASEQKLIKKNHAELGLPPVPSSTTMREKYAKAVDAGLMKPLEGMSRKKKANIIKGLHNMGIPLPSGRTASEKALIDKIVNENRAPSISPTERIRKAKAAGLLTPLKGKTPDQKEKILQGLAEQGIPLPEGKTNSEKKIIIKTRTDIGLPPEPTTPAMREKYTKAAELGLLKPLERKSPKEKENILRGLKNMGIPLPSGRTVSEKELIANIEKEPRVPSISPTEKMRRAIMAGLFTPLKGKTPAQKEKILRGLAECGILLPDRKTKSERKLTEKVRTDLGLPPEPTTLAMRDKHAKAADIGLLKPLEGKSIQEKENILRGLKNMGIPLPTGRTASEKALIADIAQRFSISPTDRMRRAETTGFRTPLEGKTKHLKENILRELAEQGILLPEGKTESDNELIKKVRFDLGLPPEPTSLCMRNKHTKAANAGLLKPLEGKSSKEKERILRGLQNMGITLPIGRTASEKALIANIAREPLIPPTEKKMRAEVTGLNTPIKGDILTQKEKILRRFAEEGIPLPGGKTKSEKKLVEKVRFDLGLPPKPSTLAMKEKHAKAANLMLLKPLEGNSTKEKEKILRGLRGIDIPLPVGRTASEKALIAKIAREPSIGPTEKIRRAGITGLLTPLEVKALDRKEKILRGLTELGIPLPGGTTKSEKELIDKVRADLGLPPKPTTAPMREQRAKPADTRLLKPLEGKSTKEKEKIVRGLRNMGITFPAGRTASEKALISNIEKEYHTPLASPTERMRRAAAAGILTTVKGKSFAQREKILRGLAEQGILLPEGKTACEKKIINKVRFDLGLPPEPTNAAMREKYAKAADAGLLKPLKAKTAKEKENILRGLRNMGISLPVGRTPSEKALITNIEKEPRVPSISPTERMRKAKAAGLLTPLKGKAQEKKEKILQGLAELGISLPEGKTKLEKKLIEKIRADLGLPPEPITSDMRVKYAKAADIGLLKPLQGKSKKEKEKILRGLRNMGIPLPIGGTLSDKALIASIEKEPSTSLMSPIVADGRSMKPVEGKSNKKKILRGLHSMGIPLPVGRTASEKSLKDKIEKEPHASSKSPTERMRRAEDAGLLTPLKGKTPVYKEQILRGLAELGILLPEGKTKSEKKLIEIVRTKLGLPTEPTNAAMWDKHTKAANAGLLKPLEGKTTPEKEDILRGLHKMGIPLPAGRTPSEKALIANIGKELRASPISPTEKMRKAQAAGLFTPLQGKTPSQKQKILRGLAEHGVPLPEGKSLSEKKLIDRVLADLGLPPEPKTPEMRDKYAKAIDAGLLRPLEGMTPVEKEKMLQGLINNGIPLPEGRTASEKSLIAKVRLQAALSKEPCHKISAAKAAGLITPIRGKSKADKERIIRGLVQAGLPLPDVQTQSDRSLMLKINTELGLPPSVTTPSEISAIRKAKAGGLFTPIAGKTPAQIEKIVKGLAAAGMPLPIGESESEKQIIKKIRAEAGLSMVPTPSERIGKIRNISKILGIPRRTPGVFEDFNEITKTTVCDHACGCDLKKIKFKHSYIRIRLTSPDISSLCSCPEECVPGVKSGVFVDQKGIKIIIGSAVGFPILSQDNTSTEINVEKIMKDTRKSATDCSLSSFKIIFDNSHAFFKRMYNNYRFETTSSGTSDSSSLTSINESSSFNDCYSCSQNVVTYSNSEHYNTRVKVKKHSESSSYLYHKRTLISSVSNHILVVSSTEGSYDTSSSIRSDTSLNLSTMRVKLNANSLYSSIVSSDISDTTFDQTYSNGSTTEVSGPLTDGDGYYTEVTKDSYIKACIWQSASDNSSRYTPTNKNHYQIFRVHIDHTNRSGMKKRPKSIDNKSRKVANYYYDDR